MVWISATFVGCAECNEAHHLATDALRKLSTSYGLF